MELTTSKNLCVQSFHFFLEIITVLTHFLGPKMTKTARKCGKFSISSNSSPQKTPWSLSFIGAFFMFNPFLTSVWDPRAQWGPQNDISPRGTGKNFLSVLVDTLRMPKIQKYHKCLFFSGQNLQGLL